MWWSAARIRRTGCHRRARSRVRPTRRRRPVRPGERRVGGVVERVQCLGVRARRRQRHVPGPHSGSSTTSASDRCIARRSPRLASVYTLRANNGWENRTLIAVKSDDALGFRLRRATRPRARPGVGDPGQQFHGGCGGACGGQQQILGLAVQPSDPAAASTRPALPAAPTGIATPRRSRGPVPARRTGCRRRSRRSAPSSGGETTAPAAQRSARAVRPGSTGRCGCGRCGRARPGAASWPRSRPRAPSAR